MMVNDDTAINEVQNHFIVFAKRRDPERPKASGDKFFYYTWVWGRNPGELHTISMCVCVYVCQDSLKTKETLITWPRAGRETNELAALIGQQTIFEPATFRSNTPKFPRWKWGLCGWGCVWCWVLITFGFTLRAVIRLVV